MKKMFILVMAVMLCFTLTACNEEENIDFSFELSSIENVEMFRFTNPADAEKK
ncbi:MAG: lipoprotein [Oscillospiraceae bacterium]